METRLNRLSSVTWKNFWSVSDQNRPRHPQNGSVVSGLTVESGDEQTRGAWIAAATVEGIRRL
eukprot:gene21976-28059_t